MKASADSLRNGNPAWQGAGVYYFRARRRDPVSGARSGWSPVKSITVTPA
ncbi:MAG: hypothetical protein M3O88_08165 [Actinomycetota bacterium]|nr:hypothetical protein [Actinomycetota bacterium]